MIEYEQFWLPEDEREPEEKRVPFLLA